jgi:hypothetical protein
MKNLRGNRLFDSSPSHSLLPACFALSLFLSSFASNGSLNDSAGILRD